MGIDIGASVIVGKPYKDFDIPGDSDRLDFFEELGLECLSPCFDADVEYCVFGVKVLNVDYTYKRVPYDITRLINEANKEFRSLTGMDGEVYFGPDVW